MDDQTLVPQLFTERLTLRGVTEADVEAYERNFVDYEVIRHLSSVVPWPYPEDGVRTFIRDQVLPVQGRDRWVWGLHIKGWTASLAPSTSGGQDDRSTGGSGLGGPSGGAAT